MGDVPLWLVANGSYVGMGLDPRHKLGARLGHVAVQQFLHWLGSDRAANVGVGSFVVYVRWHESVLFRFRSKGFDYQQYNNHQSDAAG